MKHNPWEGLINPPKMNRPRRSAYSSDMRKSPRPKEQIKSEKHIVMGLLKLTTLTYKEIYNSLVEGGHLITSDGTVLSYQLGSCFISKINSDNNLRPSVYKGNGRETGDAKRSEGCGNWASKIK